MVGVEVCHQHLQPPLHVLLPQGQVQDEPEAGQLQEEGRREEWSFLGLKEGGGGADWRLKEGRNAWKMYVDWRMEGSRDCGGKRVEEA